MDLLKMVENYKTVNEKARKVTDELMATLRKLFIDLPFEMRQVEIQNDSEWNSNKKILTKVYYPVLSVPEGYKKEQEEYGKVYANGLNHKYILVAETGIQIAVLEHTTYSTTLKWTSKGEVIVPFNIITSEVSYEVTIAGEVYKFRRTFEYEDMLRITSGKKIGKATASYALSLEHSYTNAEKKYEELLTAMGISEINIPLRKLVNSKCKEIMLSPRIRAEVQILFTDKSAVTWFENQFWRVCINSLLYSQVTVNIKLYAGGIRITSKSFDWYELKNKNHKKGLTLQEAIELIK